MERNLWRLYLLIVTGIFGSTTVADFPTRADQLRRLRDYEVTLPRRLEGRHRRSVDTLTENGHIQEPSFVVKIEGEEFILDLYLNDVLFSEGFLERSYSDLHIPIDTPPERNHHCYYQGRVRGHPSSRVAISTCNGLSGVIVLEKGVYYIKPLREADQEHLVYRASDVFRDKPLHNLEEDYPPGFFQDGEERLRRLEEEQQDQDGRSKRDVHSEMKYIEMVLVADKRTVTEEGSKKAVVEKCKEIANIMDIIYQALNTRVALAYVEVWNTQDQIAINEDASMTLGLFQNWRYLHLNDRISHDNAQLLTSINFKGATVGMAGVGTMCSLDDSCGVSQNHGNDAADVASTMAHELGHNLGLYHDTDPCDCEALSSVGCVMSASSGYNPPFNWSSCSVEGFRQSLEKGLGACMFNYPNTIFQGPICQNGFIEDGEQCDCGSPELCDNPCCVPETCSLHVNATCAIGECCHDCKLRSAGSVCRDKFNECDLPEYCTGTQEECPSNVYRQNGVMCVNGGDEASCFNGRCVSYDKQCQDIWGPSASKSHDDCWIYNKEGNSFGNCGVDSSGNFIKCARQDWYCGKLYCEGGQGFPVLGSLATGHRAVRNGHECKGTSIDQGQDVPDPGYVADGSPCDNSMICFEYHCVNHSMAGILPCEDNCNENGICNSNNNCHCDKDWSPPTCVYPGFGGSKDSGPVHGNGQDTPPPGSSTLVMIILLVLLLPAFVIGVIVAVWKRDYIKEKINTLRGEPRRPQVRAADKGRYAQVQTPAATPGPSGYIYRPKRPPPPKPNNQKGAVSQPKPSWNNAADKYRWPDEPDTNTTTAGPSRKAPTRPPPGNKFAPGGREPEVAVIQPSWQSQPLRPVGHTSAAKPFTPPEPSPAPVAAQRAALKPIVPKRPVSGQNNNWNNSKPAPPGPRPNPPGPKPALPGNKPTRSAPVLPISNDSGSSHI